MASRDEQAVLFVNEAFYRAFRDRDFKAVEALWAERAPIACVHPGWGPLAGREQVLESWAAILENPASPRVTCHAAQAFVHEDMAFVVCFERIERNFLVATNLFVREDGDWRLVHHQSGPTAEEPRVEEEPEGSVH
jgi:ketosteroid isomerase-like protein